MSTSDENPASSMDLQDPAERKGPAGQRSGAAKRWRKLALDAPDLYQKARAGEIGVIEALKVLEQRGKASTRRQELADAVEPETDLRVAIATADRLTLDGLQRLRVYVIAAIASAAE